MEKDTLRNGETITNRKTITKHFRWQEWEPEDKCTILCSAGRKVVRGILLGKRVKVERGKNPCHCLLFLNYSREKCKLFLWSPLGPGTWGGAQQLLTRQNFPPAWEWVVQVLQVDQTRSITVSCLCLPELNKLSKSMLESHHWLCSLPGLCKIGEEEGVEGGEKKWN